MPYEIGKSLFTSFASSSLDRPADETASTTDDRSSNGSPRFVPLPGNPRGGIYLGKDNRVVSDFDGSGRSKYVLDQFAKIGAMSYVAIVGGALLGPIARGVGAAAEAVYTVARTVWYSIAGTAAAPEVMKNITECVDGLVEGSPLPTTPTGSLCYLYSETSKKLDANKK
ncbi:MAG: hypothetical protein HYU99_12025 [Deltaproteobacteria bacterium]|nr:hypothetical protein [Deltaproteobacteria bacterium]